jgi:hypothetical protein
VIITSLTLPFCVCDCVCTSGTSKNGVPEIIVVEKGEEPGRLERGEGRRR